MYICGFLSRFTQISSVELFLFKTYTHTHTQTCVNKQYVRLCTKHISKHSNNCKNKTNKTSQKNVIHMVEGRHIFNFFSALNFDGRITSRNYTICFNFYFIFDISSVDEKNTKTNQTFRNVALVFYIFPTVPKVRQIWGNSRQIF